MSDNKPTVRQPWRPRKYQTPQQLIDATDAYYAWATESKKPITYTGMCLWLGFAGRACLDEYLKYEGFADAVRRAKSLCEMSYEERLNEKDRSAAGPIFALKQFGWSDRQGLDLTSSDGTMSPKSNPTIDTSKLTDDQLAALYAAISPTDDDGDAHEADE